MLHLWWIASTTTACGQAGNFKWRSHIHNCFIVTVEKNETEAITLWSADDGFKCWCFHIVYVAWRAVLARCIWTMQTTSICYFSNYMQWTISVYCTKGTRKVYMYCGCAVVQLFPMPCCFIGGGAGIPGSRPIFASSLFFLTKAYSLSMWQGYSQQ